MSIQAPTAAELLNHATVNEALEQAWLDSLPNDASRRHEEGGWIYMDIQTGIVSVRRARAGDRFVLDVSAPPTVFGSVVVATFHTHPNLTADGWNPSPSRADTESACMLGVPCIIRADDGVHTTGPASRRSGLTGDPGYPS